MIELKNKPNNKIKEQLKKSIDTEKDYRLSKNEVGWINATYEWVDDRYILFRSPANPFVHVYDWQTLQSLFFYRYPVSLIKEKIMEYKGKDSAINHLKKVCMKSTLRRGAL